MNAAAITVQLATAKLVSKGPREMLTSSTTAHFTYKTTDFKSGAEGIRTPDLRRAKADRYVPACPSVSCYVAYLRGF
jgi:hypothetical protein